MKSEINSGYYSLLGFYITLKKIKSEKVHKRFGDLEDMDFKWLSDYEYYEWLIRQEFRIIFDSYVSEDNKLSNNIELKKELLSCLSNIYTDLTGDSKNEFVKVLFTEIGIYRMKNFKEFSDDEKKVIKEVYSVFENFDEIIKIVTHLKMTSE